MSAAALQAIDLGCTLGNRRLFGGLNFAVDPGRWLMLTGANGSGKSTLLRIVAGLVVPTAGEIRWQGLARRAGEPRWHASFVYQGHSAGWKEQLTTRENLEMQAWLDLAGRPRSDTGAAVDAAIERVGLVRQRRLPFARLSAGQRRRLGLARLALVARPLWLLDEPTTALDTDGQRLFAELLDRHLAGGGCAVVATHLEFPTASPSLPLHLGPARPAADSAADPDGDGGSRDAAVSAGGSDRR
ncbi:MAG TPA: heme ABC exporter ATP-binding protein CcmA [Quisquiliibacterium sp.]|nr:heme ABC exporter ATP-binding protein CcmA [Quisquiliibacterium sp.]